MPCTFVLSKKEVEFLLISLGEKGPFLDVKNEDLYDKLEEALQLFVQEMFQKGLYFKAIHEKEVAETLANELQGYLQQRFPMDNIIVKYKDLTLPEAE